MRKPMKFKRYEGGGEIGGEANSKEPEDKRSFLERMKSDFSRITAGNIDDPKSEAYKKYGAGADQLTPRKVSMGDAAYEEDRLKRRAMERSRVMQQDISAGTDFIGRPQDEGYRPYISPRDRAIAEGEKDAGKIIENTGPRNPEAIMEADNPRKTAPKPTASKTDAFKPSTSSSKNKGLDQATRNALGEGSYRPDSTMDRNRDQATRNALGEGSYRPSKTSSVEEATPETKKKPASPPPSAPKGKSKEIFTPENIANIKSASEKVKGMGSSVADYFGSLETTGKRLERERKEKAAKGSYASGGSVSSASRRADGIATKGKTRGRMC